MNPLSPTTPTMLLILDGFGYTPIKNGNATACANMPTWHYLLAHYPHTLLHASGEHVGLLPGYIGNSEVGHITLGSGRIIPSMLKKIHDSIANKTFFNNPLLVEHFKQLKEQNTALHLMGLLSDGGVHSHEHHLYALLKMARDIGLEQVYIHTFLDGRDVPQKSAKVYLERLVKTCADMQTGVLASVTGRFYAMDRDKNWDRTKACYDTLCGQVAKTLNSNWQEIINQAYNQKITDEFIPPTLISSQGTIKAGDGIVFFNFRPDRARQLTECFLNPQAPIHQKAHHNIARKLIFFITPTCYRDDFPAMGNAFLFQKEHIDLTLLDVLAQNPTPAPVFIIAETEKYAHVTYFFRGMDEKQLAHEERVLIPSIKTKTYIDIPHMSAQKITEKLLQSFSKNPARFYLANFANLDMVGHSGDLNATIKACECIDEQIKHIYKHFVEELNGTLIIIGDHGNAEVKIDYATGQPQTAHTCNPVPCVLINKQEKQVRSVTFPTHIEFGLAHVTPTILTIMGYKIPEIMMQQTIF